MSEEHEKKQSNLYPHFAIKPNKNPSRFYAIPLLGFLVKMILLIPVFIEMIFLGIAFFVLWCINACIIFLTGKYWGPAYEFFLGFMRFGVKLSAFTYGLTDKYPGFDLSDNGLFELTIPKPTNPSRALATPLLGLVVRSILLIPYHIFSQVLGNGSFVAMIIAWFPVLTKGEFPESVYEFEQDTIRVSMAYFCYLTGLSDKYPSFKISMNHQTVKILLLIAGTILFASNARSYFLHPGYRRNMNYRYQYNNTNPYWYPTPTPPGY